MNRQIHILAAWFFGGVLALWVAAMVVIFATAERPSEGRVAVIFPPAMTDTQAIAAITRAGALPIGQGWVRWVWAADLDAATTRGLETAGALLVVREFPFVVALGCAGASASTSIKLPPAGRATEQ